MSAGCGSLPSPGESGRKLRAPNETRKKPKKRYHHGDLRRALIDDAVQTIASQGIGALNLRQLAARVGVTSGAPYHHFASREALLAAIAEDGFLELEARLLAARDAAPTEAGPRLEALGEAYVRFAIANPGAFRVMFHGDAMTEGPTKAGLRAFDLLRETVLACQSEGAAPAGRPGAAGADGVVRGARLCDPMRRWRPAVPGDRRRCDGPRDRTDDCPRLCRLRAGAAWAPGQALSPRDGSARQPLTRGRACDWTAGGDVRGDAADASEVRPCQPQSRSDRPATT